VRCLSTLCQTEGTSRLIGGFWGLLVGFRADLGLFPPHCSAACTRDSAQVLDLLRTLPASEAVGGKADLGRIMLQSRVGCGTVGGKARTRKTGKSPADYLADLRIFEWFLGGLQLV